MGTKLQPEKIVMDEAGKKRFLDLVRKAATTPVTEEQKREEREYMAKNFTTKGRARRSSRNNEQG